MRTVTLLILLGCVVAAEVASGQTKTAPEAAKKEVKSAPAQPSLFGKLRSPFRPDQALTEKLRSPRETMRTFLFAVNTYDVFPEMMEDALVCLDLDFWKMSREEGTFLALELDKILSHLEIPLRAVPDSLAEEMQPSGSLIIFDA